MRDLPHGPVAKTSPSNAGDASLISGLGAMIPHASWPKTLEHKPQRQCCNRFNEDFSKWSPSNKILEKKNSVTKQKGKRCTTCMNYIKSCCCAAKSLQPCPTLCDPIDRSPGSPIPGILQARTLEWVAS